MVTFHWCSLILIGRCGQDSPVSGGADSWSGAYGRSRSSESLLEVVALGVTPTGRSVPVGRHAQFFRTHLRSATERYRFDVVEAHVVGLPRDFSQDLANPFASALRTISTLMLSMRLSSSAEIRISPEARKAWTDSTGMFSALAAAS
jgi:hypothetical protein